MNSKQQKIIKLSALIFLTGIVLLILANMSGKTPVAHGGSENENIRGWLWSSNIGWISANCYNDYNNDGNFENCCDIPPDSACSSYVGAIVGNYGLKLADNQISGYAWANGECPGGGSSCPTSERQGMGWVCFGSYCGSSASVTDQGEEWGGQGTPAAQWKFNALNSDGTTPEETNNALDANLMPNFPSTSPQQVTGKYEKAFYFDGTDDYIKANSKDLFDLGGDFTIEAWIRQEGATGIRVIVSQDNAYNFGIDETGKLFFQFLAPPPQQQPVTVTSNSNCSGSDVNNICLQDNYKWHHVAVSRQGNSFRFYIDGFLNGGVISRSELIRNSRDLNIGKGTTQTGTYYFKGTIDNVSLWSRQKPSSEIWDDGNVEIDGWAKFTNMGPNDGWIKLKHCDANGNCFGAHLNDYSAGGGFYTLGGFVWNKDADNTGIGWIKDSPDHAPVVFDNLRAFDYGCSGGVPNIYLSWEVSRWAESYNYSRCQNSDCTSCTYIKYPAGGTCEAGSCSTTDRNQNYESLKEDTSYCYKMEALNDYGQRENSDGPYRLLTSFCPPKDIGVDGSVCGYNKVAWQPSDNMTRDADGYNIYRGLTYDSCGISDLANLKSKVAGGICDVIGHAGEALYNPATGPQIIEDKELVGWWKMNERNWNGSSDKVLDSSGLENNGVAEGHASPVVDGGKFKGAGVFDGNGDYITVADSASLRSTNDGLTIEGWVKRVDLGGVNGQTIMAKWDETLLQEKNSYRFGFDNNNHLVFWTWDGSSVVSVTQNSSIIDKINWHHVAVTYNGSEAKLWVDGSQQEVISTGLAPSLQNLEQLLYIGAYKGGNEAEGYFNGYLDNLAIYNYAKIPDEILRDAEAFPLETLPSADNSCKVSTGLSIYCSTSNNPTSCTDCTGSNDFCLTCNESQPCCRFFDKRVIANIPYFYRVTAFNETGVESPPSIINSAHSTENGCIGPSDLNAFRHDCDRSVCLPPVKTEER